MSNRENQAKAEDFAGRAEAYADELMRLNNELEYREQNQMAQDVEHIKLRAQTLSGAGNIYASLALFYRDKA